MNSDVAPERGLSLFIDVYSHGGEGRKSAEKGDSGKPLRNIIVLFLC